MMDRRSQHGFPAKRIDITGFLNHCWTEGWFDEYSNDHFLIKAIEDMLTVCTLSIYLQRHRHQ